MEKIPVSLNERSYPVYTGGSILDKLLPLINEHKLTENIFIIMDENLKNFWAEKVKDIFFNETKKRFLYFLKPGEQSKSYVELNKIYSALLDNNFGRDTLIAAVGGGVTGDLAGFAASTFMRGVNLIHVPTTLLAMVDSSIGGKTGINFQKNKNMVGSFYQPKFVFIDTDFLQTLPQKELISGLGEVIKYAYLSDENFYFFVEKNFDSLLRKESRIINYVVKRSAMIKASVVSQDEKESGLRQILNLGHTFAHAFETELNFKIKHGEAVTAGIISALHLSKNLGLIKELDLKRMLTLTEKVKLPKNLTGINFENVYSSMLLDKKNRSGKIKFVLIKNIGEILLGVESGKAEIFSALNSMIDQAARV